jgi:hypothetical protein
MFADMVCFVTVPPSPNATLDDLMPFDFSPPITVREAMSPTKGWYCYIYD